MHRLCATHPALVALRNKCAMQGRPLSLPATLHTARGSYYDYFDMHRSGNVARRLSQQ